MDILGKIKNIFVPGKSSIKTTATKQQEKHYDLNIVGVETKTVTKAGALQLDAENRTGKTMSFEPDIIEAPGASYVNAKGDVREPKEKFTANRLTVGYGLRAAVQDHTVTAGVGYGEYLGETPNKTIGQDAKEITIRGYQAFLDIQDGTALLDGKDEKDSKYGLKLGLKHQDESYSVGYTGYTFFNKRTTDTQTADLRLKLNDIIEAKTGLEFETKNQDLSFKFYGMPALFPPKEVTAQYLTLKPGLKFYTPNSDFVSSIEQGLIINYGETIPSLITADINTGDSIGAYAKFNLRNQTSFEVSYNRYTSKGDGSFFSSNDLQETENRQEITAAVKTKKIEAEISYAWGEKTSTFTKATPVDFLLNRYPEGARRHTEWEEKTISAKVTYNINERHSVGVFGAYSEADYDQYGAKRDIPNKRLIGANYTFRF